MAGTWNKREREQKKKNAKKQKEEKKLERKENSLKGKGLDDMIAYVDEFGNLSDTPPDKNANRLNEKIPPTVANANDLQEEEAQRSGVITFFDDTKGYGFIKDSANGQSVFIHVNATDVELKEGLEVNFDIEKGPKGFSAVNVSLR